jgi:hypothetical protein
VLWWPRWSARPRSPSRGLAGLAAAIGAFAYVKWDAISGLVKNRQGHRVDFRHGDGRHSPDGLQESPIPSRAPSLAPGPHATPAPMAPDGGMGGVLPQRFAPPPRAPGMQQTRVNIKLDGYRIGEAVPTAFRTQPARCGGGSVRWWRNAYADTGPGDREALVNGSYCAARRRCKTCGCWCARTNPG